MRANCFSVIFDILKIKNDMKKIFLLFITMLSLYQFSYAQSRAYTVKGGMTVGFQRWGQQDQDPLFAYHGAVMMESVPEDDAFGLFAQLGYHIKGSAWRNAIFANPGNGGVSIFTRKFKFQNVALVAGLKKDFSDRGNSKLYYLLGVRGEYTIGTNLDEYEAENIFLGGPVYPFDEAVRKLNYGVTAGAGIEFPFSEFIGGILEFTISPDFSDQYQQIAFTGNAYQNGSLIQRNYPARNIRNTVLEVSLGFKFLHKIEYID